MTDGIQEVRPTDPTAPTHLDLSDTAALLWSGVQPVTQPFQSAYAALQPAARQLRDDLQGVLEIPLLRELGNLFAQPPRTLDRRLYGQGVSDVEVQRRMPLLEQPAMDCCYFSSACSSLAQRNPRAITQMIQDNGPNERGMRTYTVTFPFAPNEHIRVNDPTNGQPDSEHGNWQQVLINAYGQYLRNHPNDTGPVARRMERTFRAAAHGNPTNLAEEVDGGSLNNAGLRMLTNPETERLTQRLWGVDDDVIRRRVGDNQIVRNLAQAGLRLLTVERNSEHVDRDLRGWVGDTGMPATAFVSGCEHEISILDYRPGQNGPNGRTSRYGVIVLRDQAGGAPNDILPAGARNRTWREDGQDPNTFCITVEDFTAHLNGYSFVRRRNRN
jgi:hypothetical protein